MPGGLSRRPRDVVREHHGQRQQEAPAQPAAGEDLARRPREQDDGHEDCAPTPTAFRERREAGAALSSVSAAVHQALAHEGAESRRSVPGRRRAPGNGADGSPAPAAPG